MDKFDSDALLLEKAELNGGYGNEI